ncbi:MAG: CAP domain-containing protein [Chloroflexi bacterium]|nr:CAP domain-containing protein [Chloroflexota bacterium]
MGVTRDPEGTPPIIATQTPTLETANRPVVTEASERATVVQAFASCAGQYSGEDEDFRARAAESAIEDGRQTVAGIRELVEEHCGGALPDSTPAVASASNRPTPLATPSPTVIRRATETPAPTVAPLSERATSPHLKHIEAKRFMLDLINSERRKAGVDAVALGDNIAAQLHADSSLENCTSSHWGTDGLKPYMRYSLAGGYQSNGENGSGLDYCIKESDNYRANSGIQAEIREAMTSWMGSPGHRRNVVDPQHKLVNIGLAWDRYNTAMYQHFEGDYVTYDHLPTIEKGMLSFSGSTRNGIRFNKARDLGVQIHYDPPPKALTRGQLSRTYCYDNGRRVAGLREPLTGGYTWTTNEFTTTHDPCPDPNDVAPGTLAPRSPNEAHQAWRQAYNASQSTQPQTISVPWVTASRWTAHGSEFAVTADIGEILGRHGNGVYSLLIWGANGGGQLMISQYSIFYGVTPSNTYDRPWLDWRP